MTPDEVIGRLSKIEVNVSRKTLYNYEKWGLVSEPTFRNSRNTNYPACVVDEAYAAWTLLHGQYGDDDTKRFFADKLPILSPVAVFAVKNFTHGQEVEESLEFLLKKRDRDKKKYSLGTMPEIKMPLKLQEELKKIKTDLVKNVVRYCLENKKNLEEEQHLIDEKLQIEIEKKIQELTIPNHKRHQIVLMIHGNMNSAITYEQAELERCNKIYGVSNSLKKAYHCIYIAEMKKAKNLLKNT